MVTGITCTESSVNYASAVSNKNWLKHVEPDKRVSVWGEFRSHADGHIPGVLCRVTCTSCWSLAFLPSEHFLFAACRGLHPGAPEWRLPTALPGLCLCFGERVFWPQSCMLEIWDIFYYTIHPFLKYIYWMPTMWLALLSHWGQNRYNVCFPRFRLTNE